jgi:hypothetical protein
MRSTSPILRASVCAAVSLTILLVSCNPRPLGAAGRPSVTVSASPNVILADGKSTTVVSATVRDGDGNLVPDGTVIHFVTTEGELDNDTAASNAGVARVTLTSSPAAGKATVTATSFPGQATSASSGTTNVDFTSNRDDVFSDGKSNWLFFDCPQYLVYSADEKVIDAEGKFGSATLRFKSLRVKADSYQVNLQTMMLVAKNAEVERGGHVVHTARLRFMLNDSTGMAVATGLPGHAAQAVTIQGYGLEIAPLPPEAPMDAETDPYEFVDLSLSHVVVAARSIAVDPASQLQFRRAVVYSDGVKVLSLPLHIMPTNGEELFGQQVAGISSMGFFLNLPYYYHVSPSSTGTIYVRNSAAAAAGVMTATGRSIASSQQRSGFALDLEQIYNLGRGGSGQFNLDGLTRSEWSARWNHSQKFDSRTNAFMFVDYPSHRSIYASSGLTHQFKSFTFNVNGTASDDPGFEGYGSKSTVIRTYLQTQPYKIGKSGINFTTAFSIQHSRSVIQTPDAPDEIADTSSHGIDLRFSTRQLQPDKKTRITDSLTIGQSWDNRSSRHGPTVGATLGLTRNMTAHSILNANYTFNYNPLYNRINTAARSVYGGTMQHRLSVNYSSATSNDLSYTLAANYGLPLDNLALLGSLTYRISNNWRFGMAMNMDRFRGHMYRDSQYYLSRNILGRDLTMSYSTQTKRLSFDFLGMSF